MTAGLVSTIVPVFNRPTQLREAVASVLVQDWRPIEVIIVDDGVTEAGAMLAVTAVVAVGTHTDIASSTVLNATSAVPRGSDGC